MNPPLILCLAGVILGALFLGTWWLARRIGNYSIVDVVWALSFAPVAVFYAAACGGWAPRRAMIALLTASWSLRLGIHLWRRVAAHHPDVDPRYAILQHRWHRRPERAFLIFFLSQAVLVWLLMLPVHLIAHHSTPAFQPLEIAGFAVWLAGLVGEGCADAQLKAFKRTATDARAVCQRGLWRYSRHPNYFFQSMLWWGLFLMALPVAWGWTSIVAPLAMLYFLLRVTGIPLTEKLSLRKRGAAYRAYQATTSAFIPWPPRTSSTR